MLQESTILGTCQNVPISPAPAPPRLGHLLKPPWGLAWGGSLMGDYTITITIKQYPDSPAHEPRRRPHDHTGRVSAYGQPNASDLMGDYT
eukprot:2700175-Prymnesium_polylepis.1